MKWLNNATKEKALTEFKDPFNKDSVERVAMFISRPIFEHERRITDFYFSAIIEFKNSNTKGEQKIEAESFDQLIMKVKNFVESL